METSVVDLNMAVANPESKEESVKSNTTSSTVSEDDTAKKGASQQSKKRSSWKKPKDKPKRPLSAYNLFFQQERECILASLPPPPNAPGSGVPTGRRDRRRHGKIGFADLTRTIAGRWKNLDDSSRSFFEAQAAIEKERYKYKLAVWRWKSEFAAAQGDSQAPSSAGLEDLTGTAVVAQTTAPVASFCSELNASLQQAALLQQSQSSYMMEGQLAPTWTQHPQQQYYCAPSPTTVIQHQQYERPKGFTEAETTAPLYEQPTTNRSMGLSLPPHQPFEGVTQQALQNKDSKPPALPLLAAAASATTARLYQSGSHSSSSSSSSIVSLSDIEGLDDLGIVDGAFGENDSLFGDNSTADVLDPEEVAAMLRELRGEG